MPKLPTLLALAEALDIHDLAELTGMHSIPVKALTRASHPATSEVSAAMERVSLPRDVDPAALDVPGRVAHAWRLWNNSSTERTAVAAVLPDLLTDARAVVRMLDGVARRQACADLAQVYHLVQHFMAYQPSADMVWLAAGLGMAAAQDADSPTAIAGAGVLKAEVHRTAGNADAAEAVAADCLALLDPQAGGEQLAMWGRLNLALALTHSQTGRSGVAWRHWDAASDAVEALGADYQHPWVNFDRFAVDRFSVSIEADLFRAGEAIRRSEAVNLGDLPSRTRRALFLMETARAHLQRREYVAVVHLLSKAYRESSETVRHRPFARQTVLELMERRSTVRDDARELASAMGMLG